MPLYKPQTFGERKRLHYSSDTHTYLRATYGFAALSVLPEAHVHITGREWCNTTVMQVEDEYIHEDRVDAHVPSQS